MKGESFGSWGLEATKMRDDFGGFPTRQRPVLSELVMFGNIAPATMLGNDCGGLEEREQR